MVCKRIYQKIKGRLCYRRDTACRVRLPLPSGEVDFCEAKRGFYTKKRSTPKTWDEAVNAPRFHPYSAKKSGTQLTLTQSYGVPCFGTRSKVVDFSAESAPLTATARLSVKSVKGKILFINALLGYWVFFCCEIFYHREGGLSRGKRKKGRGPRDE